MDLLLKRYLKIMVTDKGSIFKFNDNDYYLNMVLTIGASGPTIYVNECDVDIYTQAMEYNDIGPVIFYKQFNKYIVICGHKNAEKQRNSSKYKGILVGRLISHIALKKAHIKE